MRARQVVFLPLLTCVLVACGSARNDADPDLDDTSDVVADVAADVAADVTADADDIQCVTDVPPALTTPRNVIPYVRLHASGTQPRGFWPFEASDAIATIRDSQAATGWKVPIGEPSWFEIDLQPWNAAPVSLYSLRLSFDGTAPTGVTVDLLPACGTAPTRTLPWPNPATLLDLGDDRAGCVRVNLAAADALTLTDVELMSGDSQLQWPDASPADILPPAGHFHDSGVIEGFYGVPWSWRERRNMIIELSRNGMDAYLYAPKDDPLHRSEWRTPYPDGDMEQFQALAAGAAGLGVRFLFGISPFIDYVHDEADYAILKDKCHRLLLAHADGIAILADDIEFAPGVTVDGDLGALHVEVVNRLVTDFAANDVAIWFTPTVYSDSRAKDWPGGVAYLDTLKGLDASVKVLWTGPDTGNKTLQAADLAAVTATIGRAPLLWDNVYANDGGDGAFGRIFLAPLAGRDPDLVQNPPALAGINQNMSIQGSVSRISLATFGEWLENPEGTDLSARAARGVRHEMFFGYGRRRDSTVDADVLGRVQALFNGSAQADPPHFIALDDAAVALVGALESAPPFDASKVATLLPLLGMMAALPSDLEHSGLDPDLVDDLAFPLVKAAHEGRTGLWALTALADRLSGRDAAVALSKVEDESLLSASSRFLFSPDAVADVVTAVKATPARPGTVSPIATAQATPPTCVVDGPFSWKPFADPAAVQVFGLPGATVEADGAIRWTPTHGGRFKALVTAARTGPTPGWGWIEAELVCTHPCW